MTQIEVKLYGELSKAERREIELEENLRRKDLTAFEQSKYRKELVEAAKEAAAEADELLPKSGKNPKGGRPKKADSQEAASERTGIPQQTISLAESHVAAAERYPILQGAAWTQVAAMKAAKILDDLQAVDERLLAGVHGLALGGRQLVVGVGLLETETSSALGNTKLFRVITAATALHALDLEQPCERLPPLVRLQVATSHVEHEDVGRESSGATARAAPRSSILGERRGANS